MKKLLLLMCALLALCGKAMATTVAWDGSTGNGGIVASGFGVKLPETTTAGKVYTISSFTVGLRGQYTYSYYLAICTKKVATGGATDYSENDVIAISNNAPAENTSGRFEYKFDKPVKLAKDVVYYVQFLQNNTPYNGVYQTIAQGVYVSTGEEGTYPCEIYSGNGSYTKWTPNFTATLTEESTSEVEPLVSVNSISISHAAVDKLKIVTPSTNSNYRFSDLSLYVSNQPGASVTSDTNYMIISKKSDASGTIGTGDVVAISQNNPSAVSGDNVAERFLFNDVRLEGNTAYYLYFTDSNTPSNGNYTLGKEKVKLSSTTTNPSAWWNNNVQNWEPRYYATLNVLKTVTFSTAVAVSSDAVTTIYVATDGSDALTLPATYHYRIGETTYTASDAATAIAATGTENISVKVLKTVTFSQAVSINGGSAVSTIYVACDGSDDITLQNDRLYVINGTQYAPAAAAAAIKAAGTTDIAVTVLGAADVLTNNKLYRLIQYWNQPSMGTYNYYVYGSTTADNYKLWKTTTVPALYDGYYVWKAISDDSNWKLQNLSKTNYIAKATTTSASGADVDPLNASDIDDAESFNVLTSVKEGYVCLQAMSQSAATYLDSYGITGDKHPNYVGWHTGDNYGQYFKFVPVKTVTFSTAVAINDGDAVSTIYVACDGSDSFTLPGGNLYSLDSGTSWLSYTDAATAIAAAGTSDISVTVTPSISVTYNLKWKDSTIHTESVNCPQGYSSSVTVPWDVPAYCTFTYDVTTIESSTTEVNVTLNWDGPFDFSSDYENAIWYCMQIQGTKWLSTGTITDGVAPVTLSDLPTVTNSSLWAYVGNPVDGIKLINKGAGDGYYGALDAGGVNLNVQSGEENALLFSIEEGTNAFLLKKDDGKYMELLNTGKVGFWGTTPYSTYNDLNVRSYYCQQALFDLDQYATYYKVGKYFGVRQEDFNNVKAMVLDEPKLTQEQYEHNYVIDLILAYANTPKYPGTGYYRIKNKLTTGEYGYMGVSGTASDEHIYLKGNISNVNDASTVILVTKDVSGKYTFQTQGKYIRNVRKDEKAYLIDTAPTENFTMAGGGSAGYGVIRTWANGDYSYYHAASGNSYYLVGWEAAADASQWEFEDATSLDVVLNSDGATTPTYYATLCLPFDVTISGATAYTLARSGNYLVPTEVVDNKVPAGTPVLLKSTASSSATATINTGEAFNNGSPLDCVLTGTYLPKTIAGSTDYVLGKYNGKIGFYHWSSNNLGANRAYLAGTSNARGFELMFDDVVTGISSMDDGQRTMDDESIIYNLSGQRLNKMQKGINIVNGKKVLF